MTVSKDNVQIVAKVLSDDNSEEKKPKSEKSKRKHIDLDSCVISSGRSTEEIDNYIGEMREDRIIAHF